MAYKNQVKLNANEFVGNKNGTAEGYEALTTADVLTILNVEAGADVTDTANVDAAGAVMLTDTTTTGMGFVIDEDGMASDSDTLVPTQQSVKAYVDAQISGAVSSEMSYIGGYDANTAAPSGTANKGDVYTVTAAGNGSGYFSTSLEVGDVIIAEVNNPGSETDWTVVQKDMDAASIKTSYESNANTNAFTDAEQTKLAGIEALADVTDAANVDAAGAVMESDASTANMSFVIDEDGMASDSDTKVPTQQSVKAYVDTQIATTVLDTELIDVSAGAVDAGKAIKLDADGNVDASMINDADINLDNVTEGTTNLFFTSADNTKLDGIEALADVTDAANVDAAGAVMESDASTANMSFVIDEDTMSSDSDTLIPTQQSVKAYVDANSIDANTFAFVKNSTELIAALESTTVKTIFMVADFYSIPAATYAIGFQKHIYGNSAINFEDGVILTAAAASYSLYMYRVTILIAGTLDLQGFPAPIFARSIGQTGPSPLVKVTAANGITISHELFVAGIPVEDENTNDVTATTLSRTYWDNTVSVDDNSSLTSTSNITSPSVQAVKTYVDGQISSALTSEMSYIGGYDASASAPNASANKGDVYTVTVAGNGGGFFSTSLEVGDLIIAEKLNPTLVDDWTVVQKNMDAASIKTSYESNADTNAFTDAEQTKLAGIEALADVTDAANVDAAGAVMESDASTANMSFVIDEDTMSSDSDTLIPTQQSVKAYVDNNSSAVTLQGITVSSTYDASSDIVIVDDYTGVPVTLTIPTAWITGSTNKKVIIKDILGEAGTDNITIVGASGETIDGAASFVIDTNYEAITLFSNGTNLFVM